MRINLNISYEEKDKAKSNGAKWDGAIKKWYIDNENIDDLKKMLDTIAASLNKNIQDIANELPQEFLEEVNLKEAKIKISQMLDLNEMKEGYFPNKKPEDAKTTNAWLKDGFIPVSLDVIKTYQYSGKENTGYQYVSEKDVRPATDIEMQAYQEVKSERAKKAAEKAAQTRASKKEEADMLKKCTKVDVFRSFIKEKGLEEEFCQYYNKYDEELLNKKEQKNSEKIMGSKGNNKKIKHLPNYEEIQGKKILCFDTETTGFSPDKGDELLQVAFVTLEDGDIKTSFSSFVKPHEKTSWVGAMMKNHISPRMVAHAPYPEALKEQVQQIVDQAEVLVGYNIDFDIDFLSKGMGIDFSGKIIADPSDYFRKNKPDSKSFNLESCLINYCSQEDLNTYKSNAHKADTDAIATLKAFCNQAKLEGYDLENSRDEDYEY